MKLKWSPGFIFFIFLAVGCSSPQLHDRSPASVAQEGIATQKLSSYTHNEDSSVLTLILYSSRSCETIRESHQGGSSITESVLTDQEQCLFLYQSFANFKAGRPCPAKERVIKQIAEGDTSQSRKIIQTLDCRCLDRNTSIQEEASVETNRLLPNSECR